MPTANWDTEIVQGTYLNADGSPVKGSVCFEPRLSRAVDAAAFKTVLGSKIKVKLVNGAFSIAIPATNDPDISGTPFTYQVEEEFPGGASYDIEVASGGGPYELALLAPVAPNTGYTETEVTRLEFTGIAQTVADHEARIDILEAAGAVDPSVLYRIPEQHGAVGDGIANDTAALQAAIDFVFALGGGIVYLTGLYRITGPVTVKAGVSLKGVHARLTSLTRATVKLDSATACIKLGSGDARGGSHELFNVDGNGTGDPVGAVQATIVQHSVKNVTITNAVGIGLRVYASQNAHFDSVDINQCQDNLVLDGGSGGLLFSRCEITSATRYGIWDHDSAPGGHPSFGYQFGNCDIEFFKCIVEHYAVSPAGGTSLVKIDSGTRKRFSNCGFSVNGAALSSYVIQITNDDFPATAAAFVEFVSCNFHGGPTDLAPIFYVKGTNAVFNNTLVVRGHSFFQQSSAVYNTDGATVGVIQDQATYYAGSIAAKFGALGGANWFYWRASNPTGIILATPDAAGAWSGHVPLAIRKDTDSVAGARFWANNLGTLAWNDGTNFVPQITAEADLAKDVLIFSGVEHRKKVLEDTTITTLGALGVAVVSDVSTGGPEHAIVISGATSMASWTLNNPTDEQIIKLTIYRSAAQAVAWPANVRFAGGAAPAAPTANTKTTVTFKYNAASGLWSEQCRATDVPNS
jgi:hypothetical protein